MAIKQKKIKLVIGAGEYNNNPGWLHTNEEELNLLKREDWIKRFDPNSLAVILAKHVWEHLSYEEGIEAAKVCYEFLKHGGYIRCAVPDAFFPDEEYQEGVQVGGPGPKDHPAASHKIVHNYETLRKMFETVGFEVKLLEYCDEEGNFHYNEWDGADGVIFRSKKYDPRNQGDKLVFPSLIIDAIKS
ncbi:SAM-dependent methyltransferase [Bacillus pseudomycoides]|uniref:class I SAM-dependent methyltransferase n=1 Tax=Bacillus pseudomycoides TaxID=64104 RepID=UPI000BEF9C48|nr:SAM-dependent methyltransferase [Bacillus pseudomycoides]PEJ27786.1 SAM-dependent methyltransferase [Bacillus pseudomycoides]PHG28908.1 SAM-dependent methyltransferase [Bacillus pseudomycoides]